jgi:hypothetical protein
VKAERFWALVERGPGCWRWLGYSDPQGYGFIWLPSCRRRAHRAAWEFAQGPIPRGLCVCHRCDNPWCVNPEHLFLGTRAENNADMRSKGRQARGRKVPLAKLDEWSVRLIRAMARLGWSNADLAREFKVSGTTVCHVLQGKVWGWVTAAQPGSSSH